MKRFILGLILLIIGIVGIFYTNNIIIYTLFVILACIGVLIGTIAMEK